ncbi:hypothetical protein N1F78_00240 [Seonamhaeicola sp. MEBiC1930]|uniref:hypothetical protein n=1 Tax=Seonamhaeicola sp. MEBiC01930 TaxID=2976768 RepID=UPI0032440667
MNHFKIDTDNTNPISKSLVFVNSISMGVTKLLSITVFIWVQQFLLKRISSDEYAIYAIISSFVFLLPFITSALVGASSRYMVFEYTQKNYGKMNKVLSTSVLAHLAIGILILIISLPVLVYMDRILNIEPKLMFDAQIMFSLIVVTFVVNFIFTPFGLGLHITQKLVFKNIIDLSIEVFKISLLFTLLFAVSTKALWLVVVNCIGLLLALMIRIFYSKKLIPQINFSIGSFDKSFVGKIFSFGSWNSIILLSRYLRNFSALFLLNKFGTSGDVANFNIGRFVSRQTLQVWEPIRSSIGAPLIAMYSKKQFQRLNNTYLKGSRLALWLTSFIVFPFIIFSGEFVNLYAGESYMDAVFVIIALMSIIPFQMLNAMLPQISAAMNKQKELAIRMLLIQLINVALMIYLLLVLKLSLIELAISIAVVNIIGELFVITFFAKHKLNVKFREILKYGFIPGVVPGILSSFYWVFMQYTMVPETYTDLILIVLTGYIFLVIFIYLFSLKEDKIKFKSVLNVLKDKLFVLK